MRYQNFNISLGGSASMMLAVHPDYSCEVTSLEDESARVDILSPDGSAVHTVWTKNVTDSTLANFRALGVDIDVFPLYSPGKSANEGNHGQNWERAVDEKTKGYKVERTLRFSTSLTSDGMFQPGLNRWHDENNEGVIALYVCEFSVSPTRQEQWLADDAPIGALVKRTEADKAFARLACKMQDVKNTEKRLAALQKEVATLQATYEKELKKETRKAKKAS
tara:strand:+ start:2280 stop:2942 length:663 start_codon:yes stop_codon:yes gene_type:complete